MSDTVWEIFDGLFKTLQRQGRRVEELERRVIELERRLQERAGEPSPYLSAQLLPRATPREEFAARVFNNWPPNVSTEVPDFAPLGVTLYEPGAPPRVLLFEHARRRIYVLGVDEGEAGGDRAAVVLLRREANPEAPDLTRARVVAVAHVEKESPDRGET